MKYLVLLGDGMADFPVAELDGRTPLEVANTPAMDEVAALGICALFNPIPEGLPPGSDIGNLSVFGYNPRATYTGRAPLEAARRGILLAENEVAFRCNLVTLADGLMQSFTAGHITTEEATQLIHALNEALAELPIRFSPGVSYRHLGIITAGQVSVDDLASVFCTPPHNITDQKYEPHLPEGPAGKLLCAVIERSADVFRGHPVNQAREASGKPPATHAWLWGQGRSPIMEPFHERFGIRGAVVSAVDLVNGIGVCAGLEVLEVPGATGYLDTNYAGKVAAALDALDRVDFAYVHVEAPDETAHEGRLDLKLQAIEDFDAKIVAPCLEYAKERGDVRILVAPDHVTALSTKTHAGGAVPFALCGPGIVPDAAVSYSERAAQDSGLLFPDGHEMLPCVIQSARIGAGAILT
ncbi:MAG: cofactor-independent phosphoglycerate mutase [Candidatus Hydrogenedentes bacterium]|nr:cofactor-independent phosphoglycerate mutase [Candidatus Hydrogenedentota bacterium]